MGGDGESVWPGKGSAVRGGKVDRYLSLGHFVVNNTFAKVRSDELRLWGAARVACDKPVSCCSSYARCGRHHCCAEGGRLTVGQWLGSRRPAESRCASVCGASWWWATVPGFVVIYGCLQAGSSTDSSVGVVGWSAIVIVVSYTDVANAVTNTDRTTCWEVKYDCFVWSWQSAHGRTSDWQAGGRGLGCCCVRAFVSCIQLWATVTTQNK